MFGKKKEEMMVYVIMGFLEAGKTNLIRDLVVDDMFDDKIKTMILACEEGELEYEPDVLEKANCVVEYIEDEEAFNGKIIQKFLKKHRPEASSLNTTVCGRQSTFRNCMMIWKKFVLIVK